MRVFFFFVWIIQGYAAFNLTWGTPALNLDSNPPVGDTDGNAAIAIDPMGNAVAAWGRTAGSSATEDIWVAMYNHSLRVWTGAVKISGGGSASNARAALDDEGNAIFVWDEGFPTQIMSRTLSNNGAWDPPLSSPPHPVASSKNAQVSPQIVIDSSGDALVIWMEFFRGIDRIHSAKKIYGMPWTNLGEISSGINSANLTSSKVIAMNKAGSAIAVWEESDGISYEIHGAQYINGSWQPPLPIFAEEGKNARFPSTGIDSAGNAVIVWNQNQIIQSKTLIHGQLSLTPLTVSNPSYPSQHPDIGVDAMGNAVVVYERDNAMHKFISSARLPFKASAWTTPVDVSGPSLSETAAAGYPVLSTNSIGDGVVIWKEFNGEHMIIQGAGYSLGTWSFIKTLSSPNDNAGAPTPAYDISVAVNLAGNIMAVWPEDASQKGALQIKATAGVGLANAAPLPPIVDPQTILSGIASGTQVIRRFPAHADLINILTWTAPSDVSHFKVYRGNLSTLIGTTTTTRFEDHQRTPNNHDTYLITSVDKNGQESSPMTIVVHGKKAK